MIKVGDKVWFIHRDVHLEEYRDVVLVGRLIKIDRSYSIDNVCYSFLYYNSTYYEYKPMYNPEFVKCINKNFVYSTREDAHIAYINMEISKCEKRIAKEKEYISEYEAEKEELLIKQLAGINDE